MEPTSDSESFAPPLLRLGRIEKATYAEQAIWSYRQVPTIETLGTTLSRKEVAVRLAQRPPFEEDMRRAESQDRLEMVQAAMLEWFEPLPFHLDLHESISRAIRGGLSQRNPFTPGYYRNNRVQIDHFWSPPRTFQRSSALGFQLTGISGGGKTSAIERDLSLYPQWIQHTEYNSQPFRFDQLTWLHLECPYDGSVRGLCVNFLQAVDAIFRPEQTEESYHYLYNRNNRATVDTLIPSIAAIAANHCLGLLVIDEIQRLALAKSGGAERMLAFFVQLVNTIGVPVILVGTWKARAILAKEFAQIRRGSGQGEKEWDRMQKGSENWSHFIKAMWHFQFVRHPAELTPELSDTLYDETQGITDYAIKVFCMAQWRAISTGRERISPAMIRSVAKDGLKSAQNVLKALREGKSTAVIGQLEDVLPPEILQTLEKEAKNLARSRQASAPKNTSTTQNPPESLSSSMANPTGKVRVPASENPTLDASPSLADIIEAATLHGHTPAQALANSNLGAALAT